MNIQRHRVENKDGSYEVIYCDNDRGYYYYHREDGPAYIGVYQNGNLRIEVYWVNNEIHREDGPARIMYNTKGEVTIEEYIIHGNSMNYDVWQANYGWKAKLKGTPMERIYGN